MGGPRQALGLLIVYPKNIQRWVDNKCVCLSCLMALLHWPDLVPFCAGLSWS